MFTPKTFSYIQKFQIYSSERMLSSAIYFQTHRPDIRLTFNLIFKTEIYIPQCFYKKKRRICLAFKANICNLYRVFTNIKRSLEVSKLIKNHEPRRNGVINHFCDTFRVKILKKNVYVQKKTPPEFSVLNFMFFHFFQPVRFDHKFSV